MMVLAEDGGGGGGGRNKGEVQGEEANSKAVVAAKTGNLAVSFDLAASVNLMP